MAMTFVVRILCQHSSKYLSVASPSLLLICSCKPELVLFVRLIDVQRCSGFAEL